MAEIERMTAEEVVRHLLADADGADLARESTPFERIGYDLERVEADAWLVVRGAVCGWAADMPACEVVADGDSGVAGRGCLASFGMAQHTSISSTSRCAPAGQVVWPGRTPIWRSSPTWPARSVKATAFRLRRSAPSAALI